MCLPPFGCPPGPLDTFCLFWLGGTICLAGSGPNQGEGVAYSHSALGMGGITPIWPVYLNGSLVTPEINWLGRNGVGSLPLLI